MSSALAAVEEPSSSRAISITYSSLDKAPSDHGPAKGKLRGPVSDGSAASRRGQRRCRLYHRCCLRLTAETRRVGELGFGLQCERYGRYGPKAEQHPVQQTRAAF